MSFYHLKDLANEIGVCTRQAKRWTRKLNIPPTVPSQPAHKWSARDKDRFVKAWRQYWLDRHAMVQRLKARRAQGERLTRKQLSIIGTFNSSPNRG